MKSPSSCRNFKILPLLHQKIQFSEDIYAGLYTALDTDMIFNHYPDLMDRHVLPDESLTTLMIWFSLFGAIVKWDNNYFSDYEHLRNKFASIFSSDDSYSYS